MKLKVAAIIATVLVILTGFAMISPSFLRANKPEIKQKVMLSFSVSDSPGVSEWCKNLASILNDYDMGAAVFFVGKAAEQYPQSVSYFGDKVDVGSQTYSNVDITAVADYSLRLQEVQQGKIAVDRAGNLYSRVFRAPFGAIDQDIYSLLSRSDILADFSYNSQYNVYQSGQFVKYDATVYEGRSYSPDYFLALPISAKPIIIVFDNSYPITDIDNFLSRLKAGDFAFVTASELAGLTLTNRGVKP